MSRAIGSHPTGAFVAAAPAVKAVDSHHDGMIGLSDRAQLKIGISPCAAWRDGIIPSRLPEPGEWLRRRGENRFHDTMALIDVGRQIVAERGRVCEIKIFPDQHGG